MIERKTLIPLGCVCKVGLVRMQRDTQSKMDARRMVIEGRIVERSEWWKNGALVMRKGKSGRWKIAWDVGRIVWDWENGFGMRKVVAD
jgi:hypothetical protein